jgi:hypothetical protein
MTMAASIVCRDDLRTLLLVACRRDGDHVVLHDVLRQPWIAYVGDDGSAWLAAPPSRRMASTVFGALLRASELSICVSAAETWRFPMTVLAVPPHARAHVPETVQLDDVDEVDAYLLDDEAGVDQVVVRDRFGVVLTLHADREIDAVHVVRTPSLREAQGEINAWPLTTSSADLARDHFPLQVLDVTTGFSPAPAPTHATRGGI